MTETQSYFIDVINLVPNNSVCFIQAPSLENSEFINLMSPSPFEYYQQIILTESNKKLLSKIVETESVEGHFQRVEIRFNDRLLFEGYDGMEYGTISKDLHLTDSFIKIHNPKEMYVVSAEW